MRVLYIGRCDPNSVLARLQVRFLNMVLSIVKDDWLGHVELGVPRAVKEFSKLRHTGRMFCDEYESFRPIAHSSPEKDCGVGAGG